MPARVVHGWRPLHCVIAILCSGWSCAAAHATAAEPALHERIDALVESVQLGPVAAPAADADFLRRVYLDLNGSIPDAQTVRAFLDDSTANKREALVDRLLARPQFARHMQKVFDVMLMERRAGQAIPATEWQEYLRKSFEDGKPLDQLSREILAADGVDPALRPAVKFYLDREGEPNLLARDVGRLFFGRDLQCAQCHDHPNIEDYLQGDYYGLLAFVNRGELFTAKDSKMFYAEKADGEVHYKSVFTGDARARVAPRLLDAAPLSEPRLSKEEQYVVAPAKDVRPVPKYSRRAQLAAQATTGTSAPFNRNWANRLWAQMMGRGLVHPLDVEHSANPAVQSQLLALLAEELVRMKFDTKAFLRELALTRAYQRSSESPKPADLKTDPAASAALLTAWQAEVERISAEKMNLEKAASEANMELAAEYEKFSKSDSAQEAAEKARAEVKKASDAAAAALAAAVKDVGAREEIVKVVAEARDKTRAAVAKLPDDKELAAAAAQFDTRAKQLESELTLARKAVTDRTAETQASSLRLAEADKTIESGAAEAATTRAALSAADMKFRPAREAFRSAKATHRELTARIADGRSVLAHQTLTRAASESATLSQSASEQLAALKAQGSATAEQVSHSEQADRAAADKAAADRKAADAAWSAIVDTATARFTLAPLKELSPEQLAWATMQAVGLVDQQIAALAPQVQKDAEAIAGLTPEQRAAAQAQLLEKAVDEKLQGNIAAFVGLFGQQPGQAPSFQATVHQALFLSNGGLLSGWLNAGGNNLTERLAKLEQPAAFAEELYLSVLSRRPEPVEQAQVARYLETGKTDRVAAVRELVWSLLSSSEFRFNH